MKRIKRYIIKETSFFYQHIMWKEYMCEFVKINIMQKDQQFFTAWLNNICFRNDDHEFIYVKLAYHFMKTHEVLRVFFLFLIVL